MAPPKDNLKKSSWRVKYLPQVSAKLQCWDTKLPLHSGPYIFLTSHSVLARLWTTRILNWTSYRNQWWMQFYQRWSTAQRPTNMWYSTLANMPALAQETLLQNKASNNLWCSSNTSDPIKISANSYEVDLNGFKPALLDQSSNVHLVKYLTWKSGGSERSSNSYAPSMLNCMWTWSMSPQSSQRTRPSADIFVPSAPTLHLQWPVPSEPPPTLPPRWILIRNVQPRGRQHLARSLTWRSSLTRPSRSNPSPSTPFIII